MSVYRLSVVFFPVCIKQLKDHKGRDGIDKPPMSPEGLKAEKKMKPPDTAGAETNFYSREMSKCSNSNASETISQTQKQQKLKEFIFYSITSTTVGPTLAFICSVTRKPSSKCQSEIYQMTLLAVRKKDSESCLDFL